MKFRDPKSTFLGLSICLNALIFLSEILFKNIILLIVSWVIFLNLLVFLIFVSVKNKILAISVMFIFTVGSSILYFDLIRIG